MPHLHHRSRGRSLCSAPASARRLPSLHDLNSLFAAESINPIGESEYAAFRAWAVERDVVMDDESYCDFCSESKEAAATDTMDDAASLASSAVHRALDRRSR